MKLQFNTLSLITLITISSFVSIQKAGAENKLSGQEVSYIKGIRFADDLLKKWITEYSRSHPDAPLALAGKDVKQFTIEITPLWRQKATELHKQATIVPFGKYAVLPIASEENTLINELKKKKLNEKRLKELFFEKDIYEEEEDKKKKTEAIVYSGSNTYSVSHSFAGYFGYETSSLKGKKIVGDDLFLNNAVKKDTKGVTFNNLNYIFDIQSRKLNDGLALLPLDIKKEYSEILESPDLDQIIGLLENKNIDLIPVEQLAFVLHENVNPDILHFIEWVLTEGQEYIHTYGFLKLDKKSLSYQQQQIEAIKIKFLANN